MDYAAQHTTTSFIVSFLSTLGLIYFFAQGFWTGEISSDLKSLVTLEATFVFSLMLPFFLIPFGSFLLPFIFLLRTKNIEKTKNYWKRYYARAVFVINIVVGIIIAFQHIYVLIPFLSNLYQRLFIQGSKKNKTIVNGTSISWLIIVTIFSLTIATQSDCSGQDCVWTWDENTPNLFYIWWGTLYYSGLLVILTLYFIHQQYKKNYIS